MDTIKIESTTLKDFSAIVKDMINNGVYFLYTVSIDDKPDVKYILSTNNEFYLVSETGNPIEKIDSISDFKLSNRVLFSDISTTINNNNGLEWAY